MIILLNLYSLRGCQFLKCVSRCYEVSRSNAADLNYKLFRNPWTSSISDPAISTSEYFSPSIARMKERMNTSGIDKVEGEIEASKEHWTELKPSTSEETKEQLPESLPKKENPAPDVETTDEQLFESLLKEWNSKTNEQLFESLQKGEWNHSSTSQSPPDGEVIQQVFKEDWSRFFKRMDGSTALADKPFAEGGQAEIFLENQVFGEPKSYMGRTRHVLKVFKQKKMLQELLRDEMPRGMLKENVLIDGRPSRQRRIHRCNIVHVVLLEDGRFAFRMPLYGGDLRKFICDRKMQDNEGPPFTDDVATLCMLQIAMAMQDLHNDNIIHNDLKASNVLISNTLFGSELVTREYPLYCWVADFECSFGTMGTGFWRAPEILRDLNDLKLELFTKESDVYSYAMTCYEILTGLLPFEHEGHKQTSYHVVLRGDRPKLPRDIKPWIKELLGRCWHQDRSARPTFKDIVNTIEEMEPSSKNRLLSLWRA